ncbi:MAG: TolC family protein [Deltaproteobacteria bacterium]|nr:TolC family protein [Deltaproteobacteria bacterium]
MGFNWRYIGALPVFAGAWGCIEPYVPPPATTYGVDGGPLTKGYDEAAAAHVPPESGRSGTPLPPKAVDLFSADTLKAVTPTGPTMNLDEVVRLAVLRDPAIRAALADVSAAQADVVRSGTWQNPSVVAIQSLVPFPGRPFTESRSGGPPQLDIAINYALDRIVFGKRSATVARDRLAVDVASAAHADRVRSRVAEAVTAYVDVLQARALFVLASEVYGHAQKLQDVTNARTGATAAAERGRVRIFHLTTHRAVINAAAALEGARARLRERLVLKVEEPTPEPVGFAHVDHPAPPPTEEAAIRAAFESRPDLEASRRDIERARQSVVAEQREGWPLFGVSATVGHQWQEQALGMPNVWSYGFGITGTIPILDRNQGGVARAYAELMATEAARSATAQRVEAEVRTALARYRAAYQAIVEDNVGLMQGAGEMREGIRQAYASGAKSLVEVLDAEQAFSDAMRLEIEEEAGYIRTYHLLNAAVGRPVLSSEP